MALEQGDNTEARAFVPSAVADRTSLSRSTQDLFQPIDRAIAGQQDLPWALDFGTGADLYQLPAYTGERLPASAFMADDVEQKLDAPKIQPPSDTMARPSVIRTKEDEAIWDKMQKPHKLGKHESATHIGLSPEVIADMQKKGQASKLEFFDSAAEGALSAIQKPPVEQALIASNITPNVPNLEQKQQYQDTQSDSEKPKIAQYSDGYMPLPTLVPSPEQLGLKPVLDSATDQAALTAIKSWNPYRGEISDKMNEIPTTAWHQAYEAFPQFKKAGLSEKQAIEVMQAIVRNELYNFDVFDKADQENARTTGKPMHFPHRKDDNAATLGHAQLSINAVRERLAEYPEQLKGLPGNEVQALLNPKFAPLLVAATLAHDIEMFNRHKVPVTEQSLAYIYNPDIQKNGKNQILPTEADLEASPHVKHVMRQLAIVRGTTAPKVDEH
jgi:hypothetical protein